MVLPSGVSHNLDKSQSLLDIYTCKAHTGVFNQCQAMLDANSCSSLGTLANFLDARLDVSIFKSTYMGQ